MKVMHINGDTGSVSQNQTVFSTFASGTGHSGTSSEARLQIKIFSPGVLSFLFTYISANTLSVTHTTRLRIGGADANSVLSIATTLTGQFEDTSNTDTLDDDEIVNYSHASPAGTGSITIQSMANAFAATSGTITYVCRSGSGVTATTDCAIGICAHEYGNLISTTTELNNQSTAGASFTVANMNIYSDSNSRSDTVVMRFRINGSNGNLALSVASGVTGQLEELTNSDAVTSGDEISYWFNPGGGSGTLQTRTQKLEFSGNNKFPMFLSSPPVTGQTAGDNSTRYLYPAGNLEGELDTTEANQQIKASIDFSWSKVYVYWSVNTMDATSNVRTRINGSNGNVNVAITAATTGQFSDTTNSDSVADNDEFCFSSTGGGTGAYTPRQVSSLASGTLTSLVKTVNGLILASVSTFNGLARASVKNKND